MNKADYKILIINDEIIVGIVYAFELMKIGFENIFFAQSYEEALLISKYCRPYLVIQDILFSERCGKYKIREEDFCVFLRNRFHSQHIYISGFLKKEIGKTNPVAFLKIPPRKELFQKSMERAFKEYNEGIYRKASKKYKVNYRSIENIRKTANECFKKSIEFKNMIINGKIIKIVVIK
jgi:hypothetical protein